MIVRVEYERSNRYVCVRVGNRSSFAVAHERVGSSLTLLRQIPPALSSLQPPQLLSFHSRSFPSLLTFPFRPSSLTVHIEVGRLKYS